MQCEWVAVKLDRPTQFVVAEVKSLEFLGVTDSRRHFSDAVAFDVEFLE